MNQPDGLLLVSVDLRRTRQTFLLIQPKPSDEYYFYYFKAGVPIRITNLGYDFEEALTDFFGEYEVIRCESNPAFRNIKPLPEQHQLYLS